MHLTVKQADVGSPLATYICDKNYIVGVTTDQITESFEIIRFVRISSVYEDIQKLIIELTILAEKLNVKVKGVPSIFESTNP